MSPGSLPSGWAGIPLERPASASCRPMAHARIGIWFIGARGASRDCGHAGLIGAAKAADRHRRPGQRAAAIRRRRLRRLGSASSSAGTRSATARWSNRSSDCTATAACSIGTLVDGCRGESGGDRRPDPARHAVSTAATTIEQLAGAAMRDFAHESPRRGGPAAAGRSYATFSKQTRRRPRDRRQRGVDRAGRRTRRTAAAVGGSDRSCSTKARPRSLPASSLYAIAALDLGMPYVNFTPSPGATPPAIDELAELRNTCHAGQDGKTGETLLKSVLAPMFAARNLEVMSWVGHNIFGNLDGQVLDDPANKAAKIKSKDQLVGNILGYDPQTLVSIEYIRSLGDWKTAWDHIHFRGFLGTPMTLQFTWQGCDSLLAAPLVLDLVRFVELSHRRGEIGVLEPLGQLFQAAARARRTRFFRQFSLLSDWARARRVRRRQPSRDGRSVARDVAIASEIARDRFLIALTAGIFRGFTLTVSRREAWNNARENNNAFALLATAAIVGLVVQQLAMSLPVLSAPAGKDDLT